MMMRRVVWVWIAVSAAWAAGCGAARPAKYYQLTVPADMSAASSANSIPVTLQLGLLTGSHLYREDRIVYGTGRIVAPTLLPETARHTFRDPRASYIHVRSASNNCYQCRINPA